MAQTMKIDVAQAMKMGEKLPAPASGMEQVVCKPSDNHLVQMLKIIFISAHLNIYYMSCTFITKGNYPVHTCFILSQLSMSPAVC